jgi:multidrug efflux pump subunit AcrA (membrane-fusion protein)
MTLSFDGRVSPVDEVPLYFRIPGYVERVHVRQGDRVKAGDLLAELEADDLLAEIARAEIALDLAQQRLSAAEESLRQEITMAELALTIAQTRLALAEEAHAEAIAQARLSLELAREQLARAKALKPTYTAAVTRAGVGLERAQDGAQRAEIAYLKALDRPWEPQEVRDASAHELQLARWELAVAQAEHEKAVADQDIYQHDLNVQAITVRQAQAELEGLEKGVDPLLELEVQRAQQALKGLEAGVDPTLASGVRQTQLALDQLSNQLSDAQVVAPMDGEVISLSAYPGRLTEPFKAVIVVADPTTVEVGASLSDEQLKALTEGQRVTVTLSTSPEDAWLGAIRCLPYPYGTCGSVGDPAGGNRAVRVSLDGDAGDVRIGALAQIVVVLEEREDVVWLPPAMIQTFQDRDFVIVQDDGRQRRVYVELGIEGQDRVEIREGLEEGQMIVTP